LRYWWYLDYFQILATEFNQMKYAKKLYGWHKLFVIKYNNLEIDIP
jgi:hypothetical protein